MLVRNLLGLSIYFKLFLPSLEIWTEISFINDLKQKSYLQTIMEEDFFLALDLRYMNRGMFEIMLNLHSHKSLPSL